MIQPTIGRVIWFYQTADSSGQAQAAFVTYVHSDRMINVAGFNHYGTQFSQNSCPLVQEGDPEPTGTHARWMPYQVGQAKKDSTANVQQQPAPGSASAGYSSMPPHQQRVVDEKSELEDKIAKLDAFSNSNIFFGLPVAECGRLTAQLSCMRAYAEILQARIAAF